MHQKITLSNGVRILYEKLPYVRSASVGIWVGSGSRFEKASESGASHFIEHMVFKGTEHRTAEDIARLMDSIGGQINAFTTKEATCFYARTLDSHLPLALDVLCDMFFHAKFDEEDVETERGVIIEEIGMYEDTPEDLCSERLFAAVYKGTALGRPILGKAATLQKLTGAGLKAYMREHYRPQNIVVALSGSFPDADVARLADGFSKMEKGSDATLKPATYAPAITLKQKTTEQNHVVVAFPGLPYHSPRRYVLQLLSAILGGSMSSRLFQEVREKQGLCYNVYSFGVSHADTGLFGIYAAVGKETEDRALETICSEVRKFAQQGATDEELSRVREQSKANVLMSMESTSARMNHLARSELYQGYIPSEEEIIARYDAVTADEVQQLAKELFAFQQASLSAVGRVGTKAYYRQLLDGPG